MIINELSIELTVLPDEEFVRVSDLVELVNEVYEVAEADFWRDGYLRTSFEEMEKAVKNGEIIAATWHGELVACVHVWSLNSTTSKFGMLSVSPKYEGNGIGRLLVSAAESLALNRGCRKMRLALLTPVEWEHSGKTVLKDWYLRLGYEFIRSFAFEKAVPQEAHKLKMPCTFNVYDKKLGI